MALSGLLPLLLVCAAAVGQVVDSTSCSRVRLAGQTILQPQHSAMGIFRAMPQRRGGGRGGRRVYRQEHPDGASGPQHYLFFAHGRWAVALSPSARELVLFARSTSLLPENIGRAGAGGGGGGSSDREAWRVQTPWPGAGGSHSYVVARGVRVRCVERLQQMVQRHERVHGVQVRSMGGDADALDAADDRMDTALVNPDAAGGGGAGAGGVLFVSIAALATVGASCALMLKDQQGLTSTSEEVWGPSDTSTEAGGRWAQPPSL